MAKKQNSAPKEIQKNVTNTNKEKYKQLKTKVYDIANRFNRMSSIFESAKRLFNPKNIENEVDAIEKNATIKDAVIIFLCSSILAAAIGFVVNLESVYFARFTLDTLREIGVNSATESSIPWQNLILIFGLTIPISIVSSYVYEYVAFRLAKLAGGKSTFEKQYYSSGVLSVSSALATVILFFSPVPAIGLFGALIYFFVSLYVSIYVKAMVYSKLHQINKIHSFLIVIILSIITFLIGIYIYQIFPNIFQVKILTGA